MKTSRGVPGHLVPGGWQGTAAGEPEGLHSRGRGGDLRVHPATLQGRRAAEDTQLSGEGGTCKGDHLAGKVDKHNQLEAS